MRSRTLEVLLVDNHEADALAVSGFAAELNLRRQEKEGRPELNLVRVTRLAEAVRLLERRSFDAILVDLTLPDSFALHTYRALAARTPSTPILVLTRAEDDGLAARAVTEGAQDYLIKGQTTALSLGRAVQFAVIRQRQTVVLKDASFLDPLTGLYGHRGFLAVGEIVLEAGRRTGRPAILVLLELDNREPLQQAGGQDEIDRIAIELATSMHQAFPSSDLLARLAQGAFAALTLDAAGRGAIGLRARLRRWLPAPDPQRTLPPPLLSIGAALALPSQPLSPEDLILQARFNLAQNEFHPARLAACGL